MHLEEVAELHILEEEVVPRTPGAEEAPHTLEAVEEPQSQEEVEEEVHLIEEHMK